MINNNKSVQSLLNFSLFTLFFTNLWVMLFFEILGFLNSNFKPQIKETFYRPEAVLPEPFEMPLYLLLTFALVGLLVFIFHKNYRSVMSRLNDQSYFWPKIVLFIFLLYSFFSKLGPFPLANDFYPYQPRTDSLIYSVSVLIFLIFLIVIAFELLAFERLFRNKNWFRYVFYPIVLAVIALIIFEPGFPFLAYEYSYFFGPIWDVVQNKTIFTNANSDYGFFSILAFAALHKLKLFHFSHLPVYVWILFVIQYFLIFYLVHKLSKSLTLSLIALFAAITVNYFAYPLHPLEVTQYSAMRRLPALLLLFILYRNRPIESWKFLIAPAFFAFWIIDSGISTYLAIGATLFTLFIAQKINLKTFIKSLLILFSALAAVFLLLSLGLKLLGYQTINYGQLSTSIRQYSSLGLTLIPLAYHDIFWFFLLVYFASVILILTKIKSGTVGQLLLLSANLAFFNAFYYVGRSHPANLLDISVLIIATFFILLALIWKYLPSESARKIVFLILFLLFVVFPVIQRRYTFTELTLEKINNLAAGKIFPRDIEKEIANFFSAEKKLINKYFGGKDVMILSRDDTYLFMVSGKRDLLPVNPQAGIDTISEMQSAIQDVVRICPDKIAVDCTLYRRCPNFSSYTQKDYFTANFILQELEKSCNSKYTPVECTDKLCIAKKG